MGNDDDVRRITQLSKKDFHKKKPDYEEDGHSEGKYFCDCRVRNRRKWLGVKKYGKDAQDLCEVQVEE